MFSFIFGFIGIYKIFIEQQNKSIPFSFESCPPTQNNWHSTQLHCDYFVGVLGMSCGWNYPPLLLAKPFSLPSEVLVKWELEVMHIKAWDISSKQFKILSQAQSIYPEQKNVTWLFFLQLQWIWTFRKFIMQDTDFNNKLLVGGSLISMPFSISFTV